MLLKIYTPSWLHVPQQHPVLHHVLQKLRFVSVVQRQSRGLSSKGGFGVLDVGAAAGIVGLSATFKTTLLTERELDRARMNSLHFFHTAVIPPIQVGQRVIFGGGVGQCCGRIR